MFVEGQLLKSEKDDEEVGTHHQIHVLVIGHFCYTRC